MDIDARMEKGMAHILEHIEEPEIPGNRVDLIAFSGHEPDAEGTHNFHGDIREAISLLGEIGGGSLHLPYPEGAEGEVVYRVKGPIELASHVALRLDRGIRLYFEFDPASYRPGGKGVLTSYEGTTLYTHSPLIRAFNVENIAIAGNSGEGPLPIIDGDGKRWREWEVAGNRERAGQQDAPKASYMQAKVVNNEDLPIRDRRFDTEFLRPHLVQFFLSKRVLMEDVKLVNSPFWTVHPRFSENLTFRGLEFRALQANNDGIDPDSSRYVLIEDVDFWNGDDNVAVKAGRDVEGRKGAIIAGTEIEGVESPYIHDGRIGGPSEHILVRNCTFRGHYAICIGSEMSGDVHHLYALDNVAHHPVNMGFYIKGGRNRGGTASHVYIKNMDLVQTNKEAIRLIPNYDNDLESPWPSKFTEIYIENMSVEKAARGIRIYGWYDQPITNVLLRDVEVEEIEAGEHFEYDNVQNIVLEDVELEGEGRDGTYSRMSPDVIPPR
ncbi:MAG: glycoside hydrolase family 28 protein [Phycisphaeraceae bacterium]